MTEPTSYKDWKPCDIGYGLCSQRSVHDMYMTVKRLELEEWIKSYRGGESDEVNKISEGLEYNDHSGFSFSACLYFVAQVFIEGWSPKYKKIFEPE